MIKEIIHCDKCNSDNVIHEPKRGPVQENHRTMTEVIEQKKYNMVCCLQEILQNCWMKVGIFFWLIPLNLEC